jgi:hypothetical protein
MVDAEPMTDAEIIAKKTYRYEERLSLLCGSKEPNDWQKQLASKEAQEWENLTENEEI